MTHEEISVAVADVIQEHVALILAPVLTRLTVAETHVAQFALQPQALSELRDRVVVVETKAAMPMIQPSVPEPVNLSPMLERMSAAEARLSVLGDVRDRVVTMETKAAVPIVPPEPAVPVDLSLVLERLSAAEARLETLGDLRDRVIVVETKAAGPVASVPEPVASVDLSPVLERIAASEARLAVLGDLRDRVVTIETKAAQPQPMPDPVNVSPLLERLSTVELKLDMKAAEVTPILSTLADLTKDMGAMRERIAVAEVRQLVTGPAGTDGSNGQDGQAGQNGKDGADGLGWDDLAVKHDGERTFTVQLMKGERVKDAGAFTIPVQIYRGVYVEGKTYDRGDGCTWGGSEWHCNETTSTKPGDGSKAWTLKVKRGRDGKDGRDAISMPVVSIGQR